MKAPTVVVFMEGWGVKSFVTLCFEGPACIAAKEKLRV